MIQTNALRYTFFWLLMVGLCLLGIGSIQTRARYLTRGIDVMPEPVEHSGVQAGINVRLDQYNSQQLHTTLQAISSASGFTWIKQPFFYNDHFDWGASDQLIDAVAQYPNLTIVPLLDGDPADSFTPVAIDDYAAWTAAFAERYGHIVDYYIIWDEPNLTSHWGNEKVNPDLYAAMLTAANRGIKQVDPIAVIVAAPLAPTTEYQDSVNMAEHLYLQRLYEAEALFDVAAGKPYGFEYPPNDRRVDANLLNFSRIMLMRDVMERNDDSSKALWAGNFGWNSLPADWSGDKSAWGEVTSDQQINYTNGAFDRAQQEWHWMGVMFLENWLPIEPADHPKWGFSVATIIQQLTGIHPHPAHTGFHPVNRDDPSQTWRGEWTFTDGMGADSSEKYVEKGDTPDTMRFDFVGTDIGVRVRRADFRSRLYVTIDGKPANARPRDEVGTHVVLDAADPAFDYLTIEPVATGLDSTITHTLQITAHRGWGQYALNGFSVGYTPQTHPNWLISLLVVGAVGAMVMVGKSARQIGWSDYWLAKRHIIHNRTQSAQLGMLAMIATILTISGYFTWWTDTGNIFRRLGDIQQFTLTAFAASIFYVTPWFIIYAIAMIVLVILISFQPVHGIALIALSIPLYARPGIFTTGDGFQKGIIGYPFSPVEIFVWVTIVAFFIHHLPSIKKRSLTSGYIAIILTLAAFICEQFGLLGDAWWLATAVIPIMLWLIVRAWSNQLHRADYAVLALVSMATLSLLSTDYLDVARNEYWWVIVEPALCYLLVRLTVKNQRDTWLIIDAFMLSGAVVALYGVAQLLFDIQAMITAEDGLKRIQSFYGSPNNVALYLGRILPILLTVTLFGRGKRRLFYALLSILCGGIFLLTLSKGGILIGLPMMLLLLLYYWVKQHGNNPIPYMIGSILFSLVCLFIALQFPQLSTRLSLTGETSFARTYLWRSSIEMIADHPIFGIGLDNFLYEYRGRYLLESAWREPNLNHPHNIFFDFATRLGIAGAAVGIWLYIEAFRAAHKLPHSLFILSIAFLASLTYTVAHGMVDHAHFLVDLAFAFHLMLALVVKNATLSPPN